MRRNAKGARRPFRYARVSSADQKADLDRRVARLATCAAEGGGLLGVPRSPEYGVVEHRDRLAWFGAEYIEALAALDRRLIVVEGSPETVGANVRRTTDAPAA